MRVLVSGDRNWTNKQRIREVLEAIDDLELVIEGECRGADKIARKVAEELGIPVKPMPADWNQFGRAAGAIRNIWMLNEKPDLVIAFHNNLSRS